MTSLKQFAKDLCTKCNEVNLFDGVGCIECRTPRAAPPVRDIAAQLYAGGQSIERVRERAKRSGKMGGRARGRGLALTIVRREYTERAGTREREIQVIGRLAAGVQSRVDIGAQLGITPQGVSQVINRAYMRYHVMRPSDPNDHKALIARVREMGAQV